MLNLDTKLIGRKVVFLREVDSTNEYAKRIAPHEEEGTVVIAERQHSGKGRRGRYWASPEGGLWMSVILKPGRCESLTLLVFAAALAVTDTLEEFGIKGRIKWPNDVLVNGKKICGILTEGRIGDYVVVGVGLNVNNDVSNGLSRIATSMKTLKGSEISVLHVFRSLLRNFERWYNLYLSGKHEEVLRATKDRSAVLGREVRITDDVEIVGRAVDIGEDGALIVETPSGVRRVLYGDVSLRFV
ncbi:MAG: biotin--[acetyl-CoA-carboxylase] ligase [Thermococci archaeon]|nr:biotin--[acetyl-CoA-carboxylase] ligase [Thermococci archaeon]